MTQPQVQRQNAARLLQNVRLHHDLVPPTHQYRKLVFMLVEQPSFERFIMLHILLNTVSMASVAVGRALCTPPARQ